MMIHQYLFLYMGSGIGANAVSMSLLGGSRWKWTANRRDAFTHLVISLTCALWQPPPQICRDSHLFEFHQIIWWHEEMHLITYFVLLSLSWISIPIKRRRFLLHTFVINTTSSIQQYKTLKYNTLVSRFFFKMSVLFQISPFFKIETFLL